MMNTPGLGFLLKMGCTCAKERLTINNRRFYIRSRLAEGGFSTVDLVEDSHSRKVFALKRMRCHSKEDEKIAMREVEITKSFDHPNIITCEEAGTSEIYEAQTRNKITEVLLVVPFYSRGTVQDEIELMTRRNEHIREPRILRLFRGSCEGVRMLHRHNPPIAHRDLKPGNILLSDDDTPILMDLGSAANAQVDVSTSSQAMALQDEASERCTMTYRPPELFHVETHSVIDERTDIWSLGCVLYAMMYRQSPFDEVYQKGDSLALAVMSGTVNHPDNSIYSGGLQSLVNSMLVVKLTDRPSIDEVIARVDQLISSSENRV